MKSCFVARRLILGCAVAVAWIGWTTGGAAQERAAQEGPAKAVELKKSTAASQRAYNAAVGPHNAKDYDNAKELWKIFLEQYPDDELSPRATHYLGVCFGQIKPPDHAQVVKTYQDFATKFPKFENLSEALLNQGWAQYQLGVAGDKAMLAGADKTFAQLLALEKPTAVDQALYFQGEARYLSGNRQGAIESYQKLVTDQKESSLRSDALYALGVAHEELEQFPEAGKVYDQFLTEFGKSETTAPELLAEVRMRKAETILQAGVKAEAAGEAENAKKLFAEAETIFGQTAGIEGFVSADHATYRQAMCTSKKGDFAAAADLYAKVADNPQSVYVKEATLDAARCYYQSKAFDKAEARFRKVLEQGGNEVAEAAHWVSRMLIEQKKYAEAADVASKALPKAEGSPYLVNLKLDEADAKFEIAEARAESLALFAAIAKDHADSPQAPQALYNAAYTALQLKQYEDALQHADDYLKKFAEHRLAPDVKYVAAESNLFLKKYPEAEKLYADLVTQHAGHADAEAWRLRQGLVQFLQQKYKETVAALSPVAGQFKSKDAAAEGQYYLGVSHYRLNAFDEAATALSASYAANPTWRRADEVLLDLGRAQQKQKKLPEAMASAKKVLAEFPQSKLLDRAHYDLANYSFDNGDFKTAAAEYALVVKDFPQSVYTPHALSGQGWSEYRLDENEAAAKTFTALIEGHKEPAKLIAGAHNGRGISRQRTGDFAGGAADFAVYLASNPEGADKALALYNLGLCQVGEKKFTEAAKTYETILKDVPDYAETDQVIYELAWALKAQQQDGKAVEHFTTLATKYPDSPRAAEALHHIGEDQYDKKEYDAAAKSYAAALAKAGKEQLGEKAGYKLGWSNYQLAKYDDALKAFDVQLKDHAGGPLAGDAQFMQGECSFKLEKYPAALAAYEKSLTANINEGLKELALLHAAQSAAQLEKPEWEKAVTLLEQLVKTYPKSSVLPQAQYELGWASFNLNKPDEAVKYWTGAAENINSSAPLAARSRFMLGEAKFAKKDFKGAILEYVQVIFGNGGEKAEDPEIRRWQAKAAFQAGQATAVQAGQTQDKATRDDLVKKAKNYFQRVVENYKESDMVKPAEAQLKKLAGG